MKSGSRPRRPAACKSFKMPNFQVVSYAFSRSKNIAVACCFWIKASRIKAGLWCGWKFTELVLREEGSLWWEGFVKQIGFMPKMKKSEFVMDDENGESTAEDAVTGLGESQIERVG